MDMGMDTDMGTDMVMDKVMDITPTMQRKRMTHLCLRNYLVDRSSFGRETGGQGDSGTGRLRDKETQGQGDWETGRQGEMEK